MSGLYINRFIDKLQQLELKGSRDFVCTIQEAKNLHNDITRLLIDLDNAKNTTTTTVETQTIQVEVDGGSF